jgi:hypothetical protein
MITTDSRNRSGILGSLFVGGTFVFLELNEYPALVEYFSAPILNGVSDLKTRRCISDDDFLRIESLSASQAEHDAHMCVTYRVPPQWLRFVANGVTEMVTFSSPPSFQPSCFVPSNARAPAGTYSVSSSSFPLVAPVLLNGDFESPVLTEIQTYQNFASGQMIGGWLVSTSSTNCLLEIQTNPQCFVSLERNFIRRSTSWDFIDKGDCSIFNRMESGMCSSSFMWPTYLHFSGLQSMVIPMGMSLSTTATNLIPGLHYQLSFAAGMSVYSPILPSNDRSEFVLSLRVMLKSEDFSVTEKVLVTRMTGMSAFLLSPFVASTSQIQIHFEVLKESSSCQGECNLVRLDQVVLSLYSNGNPDSVVRLREFLGRVDSLSPYKADGVGVSASFSGVSFDTRFAGHGSKVYFPTSYTNTSAASITGCKNVCIGSSSSLVFSDSPSWPFGLSEFSTLGLMAFELQPSLTSTSGSCFVKTAAKTVLVTVSNGNLIALNVLSSGTFVFDHLISAGSENGCASSSGPFFMSTDNQLFGLVGNTFVRQDSNVTSAHLCRMLGASCVNLLSTGTLLFSASPIQLPIFYDEHIQVLYGMFLLKGQDNTVKVLRYAALKGYALLTLQEIVMLPCTQNCASLAFPINYLVILKMSSSIVYGISQRLVINEATQSVFQASKFSLFNSDGSRINWSRFTYSVLVPDFASEVESASVINYLGQQYMILWFQTLTPGKVETCLSTFLFDGISLFPTSDSLGTLMCSPQKYYGLSVLSQSGVPLLFVSYPSKVLIYSFYVEFGIVDFRQHPQMRFLTSIAHPHVKTVVAIDLSKSVSAFLMIVGASESMLDNLLYERLPSSSVVLSSRLLFARQLRPLFPSSKPLPVVVDVEQALSMTFNSSVIDLYGYGFDSSTSLNCVPLFSSHPAAIFTLECSLAPPAAATNLLNSVFISSQRLSLRGGRWISNNSAPIALSIPSSLQSNAPRSLVSRVNPTIFHILPSSGSSVGGYVVTATGIGFSSLVSPKCSFGGQSVLALHVTETEILCPVRPFMFSGKVLFPNFIISGVHTVIRFEVFYGLLRELNGISALSPSFTTSLQILSSVSSEKDALIVTPLSNSSKVLAKLSSFRSSPFVVSAPFSGLMSLIRLMTNESLQISLKSANASVFSSSAITMHQVQTYSSSIPESCPFVNSFVQVPRNPSALAFSALWDAPAKETSTYIPKVSFHPGASSIPIQVSTSSVMPSVCYLDTHRSSSSMSFNQSYLFSMGPEATFDGSISGLSVKYWNVMIHRADAVETSEFGATFTLRHKAGSSENQCPNGCIDFSCPPVNRLFSGNHYFASSDCTSGTAVLSNIPVTHLHVAGSFSFLNFSIYASNDNKSWVLVDSRFGSLQFHSMHDGFGLVPIPFVVDTTNSQFVLGLISGVNLLVPLKIGDKNFRFKIGDANIDPGTCQEWQNCGSLLKSSWSLSIWIRPESCRTPCLPVMLLSNKHGQSGGQGQNWVTLELFSLFEDKGVAAFSFSLCLWINASFSICSKSADQIYPSVFSQFVVTYSESAFNTMFDVRMYANQAEVLFHRGNLQLPQQRGFGQAIVGLGFNGYVDDIVLLLGPVQDSLKQMFGTMGSNSFTLGIAFGSELLLSKFHRIALQDVGYEGQVFFIGPGFTPFEDVSDVTMKLGVASAKTFLNFRGVLVPSPHHSTLISDLYGSRVYSISSVAAPIFVGIIGSSSGISCQSASIMSCTFAASDFEFLPTSVSSLRIVSQGMNVQSGLDLELHTSILSISPSILTFDTSSMMSVSVSGVYDQAALFFQDPSSSDGMFVPCTMIDNVLLCSYSFAGVAPNALFQVISTPRSDGLFLWNAVIPPSLNVFYVYSKLRTYETVRREFSTDFELSFAPSDSNVTGSLTFSVFSGGSFQYDVIVFLSSAKSSSVFVVRESDPADVRSIPSSGLGPLCLAATVVNSLGSFLLAVPSCSEPSISLYRWSADSASFQLLRSVNLASLTTNLPLLPLKLLTVAANEYFCVSSASVVFCFNSDFVLGTTNARSGLFEISGIKSLSGLKQNVAQVLVSSDQGLFALSLSNTRFFKYPVSSITSNFFLISKVGVSLLVTWSDVPPTFSVYRVEQYHSQVSLEFRYSGSWPFSHIYEQSVMGSTLLAKDASGNQFYRFVYFGLSSAQSIKTVVNDIRHTIVDIVAPVSVASSVHKNTIFFISSQPGKGYSLHSVAFCGSSNFLSVDVIGQITDVTSSTIVINPNSDNVFHFVGKLFTLMKNTVCKMTSAAGITVTGVALSPSQQSVQCTISNWVYSADKYTFEFPGLTITKNLVVTVFPFVSGLSVSVFDMEPMPFTIFGRGFHSGSIQNVTFVSSATSEVHNCSLSFVSSTQYSASFPSTLAPGTYFVKVYLQESQLALEVNLGQYQVHLINRPPTVQLPSTYVVDENSLAEFSAIFGVVSPGRSLEESQALVVSAQLNQSFGIVFSQSPLVYIDPVSLRLVMKFSSEKHTQVGNFSIIIRITDNNGTLYGGLNTAAYSLNVRVISAPRSPFIVTPLNLEYSSRTSDVIDVITTAFGISLGRQAPYAENPFVTYSLTSCSNVAIFESEPRFAPSSSGTLSDMNRVIRHYVTEHSTSVVNLNFSLAHFASGVARCNMSVVDSTGNTSLFLISFSIAYSNRPPALKVPQNGFSFVQRNFFRILVDLFPSTNLPQSIETVIVTGPNGVFSSNLIHFGVDHIEFHFNHSEGRQFFGALPLSIYIKTNGPSTALGSNNVSVSVIFNILKQNFPPIISLNSSSPYNPVVTIVSTGLQQVLPGLISLLSIGDSDEPSQSLTSCNIFGLEHPGVPLESAPFVSTSGSVTLQPTENANGNIVFTVSCKDDGGTMNDGTDTSNFIVVNIVVLSKNVPPMFVNLPPQVSFSEWSFSFAQHDGLTRQAFVFGQSFDSDDYVRTPPFTTTLSEVSLDPVYGLSLGFQQIIGSSNEALSQSLLKYVDDWYVCFNSIIISFD